MLTLILPALLACKPSPDDTAELPLLPELAEGWTEIPGGEGTTCSRGDPWSFFVRKGTVNRLVVDFIGGGACWSEESCSFAGSLFADDMDWMRDLVDASDYEGIYDTTNAENPLADWYHLIVPYCTGDIHWGDSTVTYGEGEDAFTIEHRGATNTRDALAWVEDNFRAPERLFVTGCSAGAYGAALWSAHLARAYPDAAVRQLADSGAGVITSNFFADSFPIWDAWPAMPAWIVGLDPEEVDYTGLVLPDLYERIGGYYPNMGLAQFNTTYDSTQVFYYQAMGGGTQDEWSTTMRAYTERMEASTPNFTSFLADGSAHCTIPYDNLYTFEAEGVRLVDWLDELANGEALPESAQCEGC